MVDLERLGADVLARILPRVYPQMLALAHEHQDHGRPAYIVTAASQELAEILAQVLALDGAIGSALSEVVDGVYTGRPVGLFVYRSGKAEAIRELAAREGIDLAACYAYSDSESDLPMLEAVGHPVAVNPDATLARIARERGWEVLRFDRLGRRLKTAAALGAAAGAGGIGTVVALRRLRPARGVKRARASAQRSGPRRIDCRAMLTRRLRSLIVLTAVLVGVFAVSALASSGKTVKVGDNYFGPKIAHGGQGHQGDLEVGRRAQATTSWSIPGPRRSAPRPRCAAATATPSPRRAPTSWSARSTRA